MASGRVNSIPNSGPFGGVRSNRRGIEQYYGFSGDTGVGFISTKRVVNSATPYPVVAFYRNDTLSPLSLNLDVRHSDGTVEPLAKDVVVPALSSATFNLVGKDAIQSGPEAGQERVRLSPSLGSRKDSFFRSLSVNPPPTLDPTIIGGNVGGARQRERTGRFPEPPQVGSIDALVPDSVWKEVKEEINSTFSLFGVSRVSMSRDLNSPLRMIVNQGSKLDLSNIEQAVKRTHPSPPPRMFSKPPNSVLIYTVPSIPDADGKDVTRTGFPVTLVFDGESISSIQQAIGQIGQIYAEMFDDPQWTYKKLIYK
jgi:hypothetical protein